MNANSKQLAPKINQWLVDATKKLGAAGVPTARLDAELILAFALGKDRTWLIAHGGELADFTHANNLLAQRVGRVPLAYITGHKEFYGRDFIVNNHVLVPRPETEVIINRVHKLLGHEPARVIDIGCGSGCIAITLKLEMPNLTVEAIDIENAAIDTMQINAEHHNVEITGYVSNLLQGAAGTYDVVVANLPYVDQAWARSPETDYEPAVALFADNHGLALIERLIEQSAERLNIGGYLLLEADPEQHQQIVRHGMAYGLHHIDTTDYIVTLQCY